MVYNELNSHIPLQRGIRFYISLKSTCLFVAYYQTFLTGTMDLLHLLKENFKNILFDLLITGRSFQNLSYLWSCSLSQRWRSWRIRSNVLRGIESDLAYTKVSGFAFQYILWSGSLWHPLSSSMLKIEFFHYNFKTNACFLTMAVQLGVAKNTSLKNNTRIVCIVWRTKFWNVFPFYNINITII